MITGNKIGPTPREDIGEEPSWVYKKPHIKVAHVLDHFFKQPNHHKNLTAVMLGSRCFLFPQYQSETQ